MKRKFIILLVGLFIISGCSVEKENTYSYPEEFMVEKENRIDFQPGFACAAFATSYVLRHHDGNANGLDVFKEFPNKLPDGNGVYPKGIVHYFENKGYEAEFIEDATIEELKYEISKGAPVIVFIHVEEPYDNPHATHYVPIVGYDEDNFYFAESLEQYANNKDEKGLAYNRKTSIAKFERLWKNIDGAFEHPYYRIVKQDL